MAKKRSILSENFKMEIARELGVFETVQNQGWSSVSSRDCGRIAQKALEIANRPFQR